MKMMVMVMIMKNVVMTLHTAVNSYNPTLFLFYRCHVFLCLAKIILLKYDQVCIFQFLIYSLLMRSSIDPMSCGIIFCCQSFAVNVLFVTFLCRMSGLIM